MAKKRTKQKQENLEDLLQVIAEIIVAQILRSLKKGDAATSKK